MRRSNEIPTSQLSKFAVVGFVGYLVDAGITILLSLVMSPYIARVPGFVFAALTTWGLNRVFTFGTDTSRYENLRNEFVHYLGLMLGGLVVNYSVYTAWIYYVEDFPLKLPVGVALGSLSGMVINFVLSKKYIYTHKP